MYSRTGGEEGGLNAWYVKGDDSSLVGEEVRRLVKELSGGDPSAVEDLSGEDVEVGARLLRGGHAGKGWGVDAGDDAGQPIGPGLGDGASSPEGLPPGQTE